MKFIFYMFLFILLLPLNASLVTGLQGYWGFENSANDGSSNNRNLTLYGSPNYVSGVSGQALNIPNNINVYAQRSIDDAIFDFGTSDFTLQAWVNYSNTANEQVVMEKWSGASGPGWTLTKLSNNAYRFHLTTSVYIDSAVLSISTNTWHQIVVRRSGGVLQMYFDGNVIASRSDIAGIGVVDTNMPLLIGRRNSDDGRGFGMNGSIDEVGIWSRAVTDTELTQLYNNGSGSNPIVPELGSIWLILIGISIFKMKKRN